MLEMVSMFTRKFLNISLFLNIVGCKKTTADESSMQAQIAIYMIVVGS